MKKHKIHEKNMKNKSFSMIFAIWLNAIANPTRPDPTRRRRRDATTAIRKNPKSMKKHKLHEKNEKIKKKQKIHEKTMKNPTRADPTRPDDGDATTAIGKNTKFMKKHKIHETTQNLGKNEKYGKYLKLWEF